MPPGGDALPVVKHTLFQSRLSGARLQLGAEPDTLPAASFVGREEKLTVRGARVRRKTPTEVGCSLLRVVALDCPAGGSIAHPREKQARKIGTTSGRSRATCWT